MFASDRWADAFIAVCAGADGGVQSLDDAEYAVVREGLAVLHALYTASGRRFLQERGLRSARKIQAMLEAALAKSGYGGGSRGVDAAVSTLFLLVKKQYFKHSGSLCTAIDKRSKELAGILDVTVETPSEAAAGFLEGLKAALIRQKGVKNVEFEQKTEPELLGGYRVRIGGERFDYSMAGEINRLKKALQA